MIKIRGKLQAMYHIVTLHMLSVNGFRNVLTCSVQDYGRKYQKILLVNKLLLPRAESCCMICGCI